MNLFNANETKAQFILSLLPITLFFPIGIGYTGIVLFFVALLAGGQYRDKWQAIKDSPMFFPVMGLLTVTCCAGLLLERPDGFWKAFMHYQIYLVLLVFISVGAGYWQQRALRVFFAGAVLASTLLYLNAFQLLPDWSLFQNYRMYAGNKSILIGILLGIAGGWMLNQICANHGHKWLRISMWLYVAVALLFLAKTRTGSLIFVFGCALVLLRYLTFSWRSVLLVIGTVIILGVAWQTATGFRERLVGTVSDIKAFVDGGKVSADGIRLEMYRITTDIIKEHPVVGSGVGTWAIKYPERAQGLMSAEMATPHNDYLLYAAEIGAIGVCALLWIWLTQLFVAIKIGGENGMRLFTIGIAIMFGGLVNAILRDALFGIAFMILLAIPLAGISRHNYKSHFGDLDR
ncbi:MAG: O-antigen ligase family protein [Herminiimonas sp.]|uniref:O-antigen ligase family protein n=1 Tax=Herminiimonas sp. TaxID=1926289 RepID=UPI00272917BC|nr:O-antigen ligase family protein [Herminiimonas sp.]MDO9419526.1 O-antigen ligase family protein [Herminiimonas sp.]